MKKNSTKDAYFKRLQELAKVKKTINESPSSRSLGSLINYKRATDGVAYGIVKENHNYYIKKGGLRENPDVSDFVYIGGLGNITNYQYKSLAEADKNRNMLLSTINEASSLRMSKSSSKLLINENTAEVEIEKAEDKLDDLDVATDVANNQPEPDMGGEEPAPEGGEEPAPEGGEEMPDLGGEETPEGGEEMPDMSGEETPEGGEKASDDEDEEKSALQKFVSQLGDEVKNTTLDSGTIIWLLKRFIQAFLPQDENDESKMSKLDISDRKEIANMILNVVSPDEVEGLEQNVEDTEKQAEMGFEEQKCAECGSFAQYAESRGYTKESIMECGDEEMTNLVSGYATAHNEGLNDGCFEGVALFTNENVLNSLREEYGHNEFADSLQEYVNQLNETTDDEKSIKIDEFWGGLKDAANIETQPLKEDDDEEINVDTKQNDNGVGFATDAQVMGAVLPKPDGAPTTGVDVNVDGQNKTVNITMNESEIKLRKYIRERLEELTGKRKPNLNESKKSDKLKKLDEMIEKQFHLYESITKNKINENLEEGLGLNLKAKFDSLTPTDEDGINKLFWSLYSSELNSPTMKGGLRLAEKNTTTEMKYDIIRQHVENNGGTIKTDPATSFKTLKYAPPSARKLGSPMSGGHTFGSGK